MHIFRKLNSEKVKITVLMSNKTSTKYLGLTLYEKPSVVTTRGETAFACILENGKGKIW